MAPRKYATWPNFSNSARALSGAFQHFSTLQPAAVACQHFSLSDFSCARVRAARARFSPASASNTLFRSLFAAECVHHQLEVLWAAGDPDGLLIVHPIFFNQFQQGLIEGLHAVVFALRDGLLDLAGLGRVHDKIPDAPCCDHYLADGRPVSAFRADQSLSNDALERARYHGAHLVPLVRWEEVYQAVDGLGSVQGVECGEDQVAGFGRREGHLGALGVPDLPYEYHVGVLPQDAPQGPRKGGRIRTHLALVYDALVVSVNELDGVLDGDHVLGDCVIDHVYHRG